LNLLLGVNHESDRQTYRHTDRRRGRHWAYNSKCRA